MADVTLVLHPAAFKHMSKGRDGVVGDYITKVTKSVTVAAIAQAPGPGKPPRNRTMINYAKGPLQKSIKMDIQADGVSDVTGIVAVGAKHAKYVIHGTAPHLILPKKPGGVLRFFWHRKGKTVVLKKVNHPGTAANDFMSRALKAGCAAHGIV